MVHLDPIELAISEKIRELKRRSGTHSPSALTIIRQVSEIQLKVDACFLSNPYATDLFLKYLQEEIIATNKLRDLLEFYPSQNQVIAERLAKVLKINPDRIFVGNGATEIIQALLHRYVQKKLLINVPTFSPYHEFVPPGAGVVFNLLKKEDGFRFNTQAYLEKVKQERPDTVVIINPNNPDGGYIPYQELLPLIEQLRSVPTVIVDESFIHFAREEEDDFTCRSLVPLTEQFPNLVIIKSMSKDFGVAGIRAGYAAMDPARTRALLENGFLWNSSGLAEYFFDLYSREDFLESYEKVRRSYIEDSHVFFRELSRIPAIRTYSTQANFILMELLDGSVAEDTVCKLLIKYGIYLRACDDKKGLEPGRFLRVASRTHQENEYVLQAFREILG